MTFLIFTFGILLAMGLFLILADLLKLPSLATQKAMLSASKQGNKKVKSIDALLIGWAVKLAKYIPIDEYKRNRMKNTLDASGINMTPEEYIASAIVKAGLIALGIVPCLIILPLLAPIIVFISILIYFKEIQKADEKLKEKRDRIEIGRASCRERV